MYSVRILGVEDGDEDGFTAVRIELEMESTLGKDCHAVRQMFVTNFSGSCLGNEFGDHTSFDEESELGCAGMCVRGIETTVSMIC